MRITATEPAVFQLTQAWAESVDPRLQSTMVEAYFREGKLVVEAALWDENIGNTATEHNQRTWEMGDVFEIFVRRADSEAYTEVHVTPENIKLHLHFQDFQQHQQIASIQEVVADPAAISSAVERFEGGWNVKVAIPVAAGPGDQIRVSFCRYDYAPQWDGPVLSSSSPHPVLKFHRPEEWELLEIHT